MILFVSYVIVGFYWWYVKYIFSNRYEDSDRRFQHVLEACGVYKSLKKMGVKEGDTVIIGEVWT